MKNVFTPLLTVVFLLIGIGSAYGQNKIGRIGGTIQDENNKAIESATVTLLRAKDSATVKFAVSNKEGEFEFEKIALGNYIISVSAMGFKKGFGSPIELTAENHEHQVPPIQLNFTGKTLGAVTLVGKVPLIENKIDRTVVNVDAAPTNAGSSALEVLEKAPGVTVSNEGVISLRGKQGVIVMMDGKPTYLSATDLANVLRNMPASALDQIEIMTNPPAKYDASGNSGIINIKTKKSKNEGLNGSISQGMTISPFKRYDSYEFPIRNTTSLNLNYRKGKVNVFGNFNYNYNENRGQLEIDKKFFEKDGQLNSLSETRMNGFFRNNNYTMKVGVDYYANKKNIFGVVLNGFTFFGRPRPFTDQTIRRPDGTVETILRTDIVNKNTFSNYSANFNYKHNFDSAGREFTADLDYVGYFNHGRNLLTTDIYDGTGTIKIGSLLLRGDLPGIINIFSLKGDYVHPLKKKAKLEAGFKSSYVKNDNEVDYERWQENKWMKDARSNQFIYEENINAAYVSVNKQWKKLGAQVGLRLENTIGTGKQIINDSTFKRNYTSLFPTGYVNYDVNKKNSLTLSLGRRIERPSYWDLNPFTWFIDSLSYRVGNPYLLPQYAYNMELKHTYKGQYIIAINYTITDDVISQLLKQNTEKRITFLTVENVAKYRNIGIAITAPFKPTKWWSTNIFVNVFNNRYEGYYYNGFTGKNDPLDVDYTAYLVNITNSFTFPKGWTGEISGWYRSKGVEQLTIADPMYFMNLGAQKTVLKGKGTLRLGIRDPFHWQRWGGRTKYSDIDVRIKNRWSNRSVTVTFSYRFGKNTVAQARRRTTGTSEEQNRAGGGQQ